MIIFLFKKKEKKKINLVSPYCFQGYRSMFVQKNAILKSITDTFITEYIKFDF